MKDRFGAKEWATLTRLPGMLYQFIAPVGRPEFVVVLQNELKNYRSCRDPLHRALFEELSANPGKVLRSLSEASEIIRDGDIKKELAAGKRALKRVLAEDEYHRFFASLFDTAAVLINAGTGETRNFAIFIAHFEADLDAGETALQALDRG